MTSPRSAILTDLQERLGRIAFVQPGEVAPGTRFREDLEIDSLTAVALLIELEDHYGIRVADAEALGLETVADAIALIEQKIAAP
ncbi:MAG TPA: acyl carrier protein [Actinomycetota bacterium]|nr:acyl carrier protein [Actinomycetota bacterium]